MAHFLIVLILVVVNLKTTFPETGLSILSIRGIISLSRDHEVHSISRKVLDYVSDYRGTTSFGLLLHFDRKGSGFPGPGMFKKVGKVD